MNAEVISICIDKERTYNHNKVGTNFRMTNLQAALGLSQITRIDEITQRKRNNYHLYQKLINDQIHDIEFQRIDLNVLSTNWVVAVRSERFNKKIEAIQHELQIKQIETRRLFKPLSNQKFNKGRRYLSDSGENAQQLYDSGLYLPSSIDLSPAEIQMVVDNFARVVLNV